MPRASKSYYCFHAIILTGHPCPQTTAVAGSTTPKLPLFSLAAFELGTSALTQWPLDATANAAIDQATPLRLSFLIPNSQFHIPQPRFHGLRCAFRYGPVARTSQSFALAIHGPRSGRHPGAGPSITAAVHGPPWLRQIQSILKPQGNATLAIQTVIPARPDWNIAPSVSRRGDWFHFGNLQSAAMKLELRSNKKTATTISRFSTDSPSGLFGLVFYRVKSIKEA